MPEQGCTTGAISRRPARFYTDEQDYSMELNHVGQGQGQSACSSESRYGSGDEPGDWEKGSKKNNRSSSSSGSVYEDDTVIQMVDLGRDIEGLFPRTYERMGKQVAKSLQQAKNKLESRPPNFGIIVPGAIYRSSFPSADDYSFLASLDLKTVVTLVEKEYPPEFKPFLAANGIRHLVIDMKGTKKVAIPEEIMHSILDITLNKSNHPILIHCNHGKHRTGCAAAVIRHIAGWKLEDIVEEYSAYAEPKIRECDIKYIIEFEVASLEGLFLRPCASTKSALKIFDVKMLQYLFGALFLMFLCIIITISVPS